MSNGRYSNAYYLAGYAVEMALKACIAAQIAAETIPDKELLKGILSHQFSGLVGLAGLRGELRDSQQKDPDFEANWAVVSDWSPDARYELTDPTSAQTLIEAIRDRRY
jgi:HEPN domain-containing protein